MAANADLFAWTTMDIPRVDPLDGILHCLFIFKGAKSVSQKRRKLGEERRHATKVKAENLLKVGFIKEAKYTTWLTKVLLAIKTSRKWRMCLDYTDFNRACPKDVYPMLSIQVSTWFC